MSIINHRKYLLHALKLAEEGRGISAPNPSVGAVIVKNNKIIGAGFHHGPGTPHAEVEAFENCSEDPSGAAIYVSLEPCCHWGRTPPCVDLIIKEGISIVYYGSIDPNPIVSGRGMLKLQEAGISCNHLALPEVDKFYKSYNYWNQTGLPWVTAKLALSLDGRIAGEEGETTIITGETAAEFTHYQRYRTDAILTTARTIEKDDPKLNVRLAHGNYKKRIYILDRTLTIDNTKKIFQTAEEVIIFYDSKTSKSAIDLPNAVFHPVKITDDNKLNFREILSIIGKDGVHDLWVEAGATCFNTLLNENLLNKAYIYMSLKILGDKALHAFNSSTDLLFSAKNINWQQLGRDMVCEMDF